MPFADAFEKPFVHSAAPSSSTPSRVPMMAAPSVSQHGVTSARRAAPVAAPQQSVDPLDGPVLNMSASENRPWSIDHSADDMLPARRIW